MCTSMPLLIFMLFELVIPQKYYWVSFLLAFIYGFCPLGYLNSITTLNIWVGLFKHYGITNLDVINKIRFCKKWDRPWSRGFGGAVIHLVSRGSTMVVEEKVWGTWVKVHLCSDSGPTPSYLSVCVSYVLSLVWASLLSSGQKGMTGSPVRRIEQKTACQMMNTMPAV